MQQQKRANAISPAPEIFLIYILISKPFKVIGDDMFNFERILSLGVHVATLARSNTGTLLDKSGHTSENVSDVLFGKAVKL